MPENGDTWKCNKRVDQGKIERYARCKLVCQEGYDLSKGKRRDFHRCKRTGTWMTTENVILSCRPNGKFFAEKLRIAMNQIQSFEIDTDSLTRLIHELRIENEQYQQVAADSLDQCQVGSLECIVENEKLTKEKEKVTEEKEKLTETNDLLKNDLQECSSNRHDSLKPAGHVGISVIRQVENARETDTCIGTETNSGYITSRSCCQADQMFLFEFENSTEIAINLENSIWIEENICFINTTESFKFHFPALDGAETQKCTFRAYDDSLGEFNQHQIEIETKGCVDSTCSWKIDSLENAIILDGTSIVCNGSPNLGIITKSKLLE